MKVIKYLFCLTIIFQLLLFASCTQPYISEQDLKSCKVESISLIDAEKDVLIEQFDPIKDGAVIKISEMPEIAIKANLSTYGCAEQVYFGFELKDQKGHGALLGDLFEPFTLPASTSSVWFGKRDFNGINSYLNLKGNKVLYVILNDRDSKFRKEFKFNLKFEE